jgi:hypothetical protein
VRDYRIAVVTAIAAIFGATVGAVATYLSTEAVLEGNQRVVQRQIAANQAVVQGQVGREEKAQARAAAGAAAVYAEQLGRAHDILEYALRIGRWPGRNNLSDVALPTLEDRRLILSRLPSRARSAVVTADGVMRTATSIIEVNAEHQLRPKNRPLIVSLERQLRAGVNALRTVE